MKKRAEELKPGDTVVLSGMPMLPGAPVASSRLLVLHVIPADARTQLAFEVIELGKPRRSDVGIRYFTGEVEVEGPELTRPQQHADMLFEAVKQAHELITNLATRAGAITQPNVKGWLEPAASLINQVAPPPAPPTLDEALVALRLAPHDAPRWEAAGEIVERARATGLLG